ncbi:glycosyltransferase family 4 protein [Phenylobacterium sp.]|uniref:glycosyltransferase family 4 protein n=1 Tax=Phenylobacterium sp. TaxID=1871053 RepID=UPI002CE60AFE|nr:glycosyltransferase family 4 protein [Phenylobacterium sp.]HVI34554.1 glycosyltransferase family 4 protein [Phenylobacterium sp.]
MSDRLAVFHPPGHLELHGNPFGKDVANLELYRALALHGGFRELSVLSLRPGTDEDLARELLEGRPCETRLTAGPVLNQGIPAAAGALLRGQPDLYELSWLRRRAVGDRAYSLLGLAHTLAPPAMRQVMAMAGVGPTHPWDAIICTSPSVRDALSEMFAEWGEHLAERTGGRAPPQVALPIIPLGVEAERFARLADRPEVRASRRAALDLAAEDVLILWVGRLSYFEKAFPQPMLKAATDAARATGAKVRFLMAGWFPSERDRELFGEAVAAHAPDLGVTFVDGNDRELLGELWAAADIFLSLVDNIQETFGITPLEAMAAGLPVVASDWDGYRYTMRDGAEAFLIPTLLAPAGGLGDTMVLRHTLEADIYQAYVGTVAQYTAANVGRAARALATLIAQPDLRRLMGQAGRARVQAAFDWPVVARQYRALIEELAAIRKAAPEVAPRHRMSPIKGDPFRAFRGFATAVLELDTTLVAVPGAAEALARSAAVPLDQAFSSWRASLDECARAVELLASGRAGTVREVLMAFPTERRRAVELGLVWMAKHGIVDWLT